MITKIVKSKNCKCGSGSRYTVVLPSGVTKGFIENCKKLGFTDNEKYTKAGLLYLQKDLITISGALCLKNVSIYCSKKDCEKEIEETIALLEPLF